MSTSYYAVCRTCKQRVPTRHVKANGDEDLGEPSLISWFYASHRRCPGYECEASEHDESIWGEGWIALTAQSEPVVVPLSFFINAPFDTNAALVDAVLRAINKS